MAKLKDLIKEHAVLGGMVSQNAFSNLDMGFNTKKSSKLTDIVEDVYGQSSGKIDTKGFMNEVGNFNSFGNEIYREGNLRQLAEKLSRLAETAKAHTLQETEDWFDKITVNRNMKELTNLSGQFKKVATEAQSLQERMSGLYEDMGHILGRYYTIGEAHMYGHDDEDSEDMNEADKMMFREEDDYKAFFKKAMKKFNVSDIEDMSDDDKKDFFNYVDRNYKAKKETD